MAKTVNIHEAKTHFSKLLESVQQGEEVLVAKAGRVVAKLVPAGERQTRRSPGTARGQIKMAEDFDAPLPDDLLECFEK